MCTPQAALGIQVAGGVNQTIGAYFGAKAQQSSLKGSARVNEINAEITDLSAREELMRGVKAVEAHKLATGKLKSDQEVAQAASGVSVNSDSAVAVRTTTDVLGELDANQIRANAVRSAWGYKMEGVNYRNQALSDRTAASAISPFMSAGTTALGAAGNVLATRYQFQKEGAIKPGDPWYWKP